MVEYKNIFSAGAPGRTTRSQRLGPIRRRKRWRFERRATMAARALAQAEDDLSTEKTRRGMATEDDARAERISRIEREAILTERKRILAILDAPVAVRRPRLARKFIESDVPARDTIEAMEGYERESAASRAKSAADLIVLAGQMREAKLPHA